MTAVHRRVLNQQWTSWLVAKIKSQKHEGLLLSILTSTQKLNINQMHYVIYLVKAAKWNTHLLQ
jgi:hypothetical protein